MTSKRYASPPRPKRAIQTSALRTSSRRFRHVTASSGVPNAAAPPRLHLDEGDGRAPPCHQVQVAVSRTKAAVEHRPSPTLQPPRGDVLAQPSEGLTGIGVLGRCGSRRRGGHGDTMWRSRTCRPDPRRARRILATRSVTGQSRRAGGQHDARVVGDDAADPSSPESRRHLRVVDGPDVHRDAGGTQRRREARHRQRHAVIREGDADRPVRHRRRTPPERARREQTRDVPTARADRDGRSAERRERRGVERVDDRPRGRTEPLDDRTHRGRGARHLDLDQDRRVRKTLEDLRERRDADPAAPVRNGCGHHRS